MTIAQIFEITNQQIVKWNKLSLVKTIFSLVSLIHQSESFVQIEDVLFLIIRTARPKFLSLSPNIIGTLDKCNGPLIFITEGISHLRGRTTEGKPEGLNPHGKKEAFQVSQMNDISFLCHAVCLLTVNSDRLRSTVWKVASADSSTLKVAVLKREHSVPSTAVSPLTGARCYSLTPPCVKANREALFKQQLLRRCTISWN